MLSYIKNKKFLITIIVIVISYATGVLDLIIRKDYISSGVTIIFMIIAVWSMINSYSEIAKYNRNINSLEKEFKEIVLRLDDVEVIK